MGASTAAAGALVAAANHPELVSAVISRGGRVDLAHDALDRVEAPALLIVGGNDRPTLRANRAAIGRLRGGPLEVVASAGHTFEEVGALGTVGEIATRWLAEAHVGFDHPISI
jgi:pimeloyl-ACP methyl ester carboxylesterase